VGYRHLDECLQLKTLLSVHVTASFKVLSMQN
jgi:hypothetical protein